MALAKKITNENGVETNYHKIERIAVINKGEIPTMIVSVKSFVNEDIRKNDVELSASETTHRFSATKEELEKLSIFDIAYTSLKSTELFSGSADC